VSQIGLFISQHERNGRKIKINLSKFKNKSFSQILYLVLENENSLIKIF